MNDYSENALVEQPTIALFKALGWEAANGSHEFDRAGGSPFGRETKGGGAGFASPLGAATPQSKAAA